MTNDILSKNDRDEIKKRDLLLIKSTLKGNNNSFAKLMTYYKQRVLIFGKSFFHNEADADDFVQDVFIKVFMNLKSFKGNSLFSTWLMKIAYTTAINSVNRRKEYLPILDNFEMPSAEFSPEEKQIRKITQSAIREAIQDLPEKYSICIDMFFSYDIPYQNISEITGFPINTIKSHIFRAKKLLKEKLEEYYEK